MSLTFAGKISVFIKFFCWKYSKYNVKLFTAFTKQLEIKMYIVNLICIFRYIVLKSESKITFHNSFKCFVLRQPDWSTCLDASSKINPYRIMDVWLLW